MKKLLCALLALLLCLAPTLSALAMVELTINGETFLLTDAEYSLVQDKIWDFFFTRNADEDIMAWYNRLYGPRVLFDVNGNGEVDLEDVWRMLRHTMNVERLGDTSLADFNDSGTVDLRDTLRALEVLTNARPETTVQPTPAPTAALPWWWMTDSPGETPTPSPTPEPTPVPSVEVMEVYNAMIALKSQYPEGMYWTNDDFTFYPWKGGGIYYAGYGCVAFAYILSDAAFGSLPSRMYSDVDQIRVGDILRINHDTHTVIVLEVYPTYVIVAEGNYNSSIHWGRKITKDTLRNTMNYAQTRYPQ